MDEAMHKAIQERAYFLWLEAGCPEGLDVLHWLQAEAEAELGLNPKVDEKELLRALARLPLGLGVLGPNGLAQRY